MEWRCVSSSPCIGAPMCLKENQENRLACAWLPSCPADMGGPPPFSNPSVDCTLEPEACKQPEVIAPFPGQIARCKGCACTQSAPEHSQAGLQLAVSC